MFCFPKPRPSEVEVALSSVWWSFGMNKYKLFNNLGMLQGGKDRRRVCQNLHRLEFRVWVEQSRFKGGVTLLVC